MSNGLDLITYFPREISFQVFERLSLLDLGRCCRVNRIWAKTLEGADELWLKALGNKGLHLEKNVKSVLFSHPIRSFDVILYDIESSMNEILSKGQKGHYFCLFPKNCICKIDIEIGHAGDKGVVQGSSVNLLRHFRGHIGSDRDIFHNFEKTTRWEEHYFGNPVHRFIKVSITLPEEYSTNFNEIKDLVLGKRTLSA